MTFKEVVYTVFAFVASAFAAQGAIRFAQIIFIEGSFKPLLDERSHGLEIVGLVVFFAALSLMIKGINAIHKERYAKEWQERERRMREDDELKRRIREDEDASWELEKQRRDDELKR